MSGNGASGAGGPPSIGSALLRVGLALALLFGGIGAGLGYWQVVQAQALSSEPGNPLVQSAARNAPRGRIFDASGETVAFNDRGADGQRLRRYSFPAMAPVLGYQSPRFGTAGLERAFDAELTGLKPLGPGGDMMRKFLSDPYDPSDLHLSVDVRLQAAAAAALGGDRGSVVAIEPATGRVLALVSNPTFDANRLVDPASGGEYLESLRGDRSTPLLNRATQGRFVPGSVFKIVTAAAALGSGAIDPATTYPTDEEYDTGFRIEGFTINDSARSFQRDHPLDFYEATEVSSNIWFAHAALDTGADELLASAQRFGFGSALDFDLPTTASQVTSGDGPLSGFTDRVELANAAYGQGEILVTPLQMAMVAACVANDGVLMRPHLVDRLESESGRVRDVEPSELRTVISAADAAAITQAMVQAVEGEYGQFYAGGAKVAGVTTAGKSGSAQLAAGRPHSWFIGFAPAEQPRIAIAVIVERAGSGSEVAVPLGGDLMSLYLEIAD